MEQRVSRADLRSPDGTPAPESDVEIIARLKKLNNLDYVLDEGHDEVPAMEPGTIAVEDDQLEFQLFASTNKLATEPANRIRLRSPTPPTGDPGLVNSTRNSDYYFAPSLTAADEERLASSALSGEDVLSRLNVPWPGSRYAWKVLHLPPSSLTQSARTQNAALSFKLSNQHDDDDEAPGKRTRPGKKTRIKVRVKLAASRTAAQTKEVAEKEKRIRRNREKKVKKRLREKAKKVGGGAGGGQDEVAGVASDEESGSE
ncbi:hypothetical protein LTR85_003722 [Meristemomyces frigidus]|nr:hypothetical protein LTR85_003722 [Meristemomyces frigidus]